MAGMLDYIFYLGFNPRLTRVLKIFLMSQSFNIIFMKNIKKGKNKSYFFFFFFHKKFLKIILKPISLEHPLTFLSKNYHPIPTHYLAMSHNNFTSTQKKKKKKKKSNIPILWPTTISNLIFF